MNSIFNRTSIRKYSDKEISEEDLEKILRAAMAAPSAGNQQPWHFIVVRDKEKLARLSETSQYAKMVKDSSLSIIVCADLDLERLKGYWVQDCSAAIENMLIEITELGLGGVWLGVYPEEDRVDFVRKEYALPSSVIPLSIISIGHPTEEKKATDRYNAERVHHDKW